MFEFTRGLSYNLDWDAWIRLAQCGGAFAYIRKPLMIHRIHRGSELVRGTTDQSRRKEDELMFERFWPKPIAMVLSAFYRMSYQVSLKGGTA
jgi:hypothetical protein